MNDLMHPASIAASLIRIRERKTLADPRAAMLAPIDQLRPPEDISTHEVACRFRKLQVMGGGYTDFDPDKTPYLEEIHDACDDPTKRFVIVKGPARSGKTVGFENYAIKIGQFGPSRNLLWYMHSGPDVQRYVAERVDWMLNNHEELNEKWDRAGKNKWDMKKIDGAIWEWLAANASTTRGRSAAVIVGDEVDAMRPSIREALITLIENRQREYGNMAKGLLASHPDAGPEFGVDAYLIKSDRRLRIWTCPACAHLMSPCVEIGKTRRVTWNIRQLINSQKDMPVDELTQYVAENVALVCPNPDCGLHFGDTERLEMDRAGVWMRRGLVIDEHENIVGTPEVFDRAGFVIHAFMAPFVKLAGLSQEWMEAWDEEQRTGSHRKMKEVLVKSLGETDSDDDEASLPRDWEEVKSRLTNQQCHIGVVPQWVRFLTAFVDVQGASFETTVIGWDEQKQSVLIDRFSIKQRIGLRNINPAERLEDWDVIEQAVLNQVYPVAGSDELFMGIAKVAVDSGGEGAVTENARNWFANIAGRPNNPIPVWRVLLSRGGAHRGTDLFGKPRPFDKDKAGRPLPVTITERTVNVHEVKNMIARRMGVPNPGPLFMHLPADLDDAYGKELVAETRVMGQWMKTGGRRNETWDGWVMAEVCRALLAPEHFAIDWKNNPPFWAKPFKLSPNEDGDVKESAVQGFFSRLAKLNS